MQHVTGAQRDVAVQFEALIDLARDVDGIGQALRILRERYGCGRALLRTDVRGDAVVQIAAIQLQGDV